MSRRRIINKNFVLGKILGGLGNQLFVIFTTVSHAIDNNLDFFVENMEKTRKTYFDTPLYKNLKQTKLPGKTFFQPSHRYCEIPKQKNLILSGYFQSYKFFDHNKEKILKLLEIDLLRDQIKEKYSNYLSNDVILHFRLGDYKHLGHAHPICDISYYKNALKNFDSNSKVLYFFEEEDREIVLDKIKEIKEEHPEMIFTPIDTNIVDYEQVLLMSQFSKFVIANSTFSWWGAYLSQNREKVCYPSTWFCGVLKDKCVDDLFYDDWIKV